MRVAGKDRPAQWVLDRASQVGDFPIQRRSTPITPSPHDCWQIDLALSLETPASAGGKPEPDTGYAGLTPAQRFLFLDWLADAAQAAPSGYQQIYLANLEVRLFEGQRWLDAAHTELLRLEETPGWNGDVRLARAIVLGHWIKQDGAGLAQWIARNPPPMTVLGLALGCQALLDVPLSAQEIPSILVTWNINAPHYPTDALALRLDSLTSTLGAEPLAYALSQLDDQGRSHQPWHTSHRDLRIAIPQPDVRPVLAPLLADMLAVADVSLTDKPTSSSVDTYQESENPDMEDVGWRLILEFGQSRSDYFHRVLQLSQRMSGYTQIMDENRKLVHRVVFRKSDMRRCWRIWDYVQNWSNTRVFIDGQELEKWKVWPYSQYLR